MTESILRDQLVYLAKSLFDRGYATGGSGNLSLVLPTGEILATPTGASLGRLTASNLSVVDLNGNHISGAKPSKEIAFHLAIYTNNPACKAIVHLHSTYLTALSCLKELDVDNAIKPFTPYVVMRIGTLPVIPYLRPGDNQIAHLLGEKAPYARAFLLANHGSVVTGQDIFDAVDNAEELEETAKLIFLLKNSQIRYLTNDEIDRLKGMGK